MPKCNKNCAKPNCIFFKKAEIPAVVANDDITPPRNGDFCNMLVVYEATGNAYLFASDGIPTLLSSNDYRKLSHLPSINGVTIIGDLTLSDIGVTQLVEEEADARRDADSNLQEQIDTIAASSDVVDIVGTYQELMQYDTSHLTINDVIKVLDDETENDATTYYRWTNDGWLFIGQEGPYYTKSQVNELLDGKLDDDALDDYYDKAETDALLADKADVSDLAAKQDKLIAGANITIDQATNTISATVPSLDNYYTKQETYSQTEVNNLISDVEADIPTATSQLTNDSGFLTTLPIATSQILGGIKVGSGLSVTSDGTLSADAQHIDVDTALSTTSTNPVENRVITNALNDKANLSDIPTVPTNVSAFYNDAGYVTSSTIAQNYYNKTETYNQTEVDSLISGVSADIPTKTSGLTNDGATGTSTYVELSQLATVATSGSYNDLTDKPTVMTGLVEMSYGEANAWAKFIAAYQAKQIVYCRVSSAANPASGSQTRKAFMAYVNNATNPTSVEFQYVRSVSSKTASQPVDQVFVYTLTSANGGTWTVTTRDMGPKLAQGTNTTVSYSNGTYTISATQPTVPTKTSDLTNDGSDGTSTYVEADQLAAVATSGSYNDLSNRPTIPAAQVNSDWNASSGVAQILNKPTLATVATSGLYSDLTGTPSIPIVNNATLTIQRNGTNVGTFTANASSNVTANISVPTKTSDLTNDGSDNTAQYLETDETAYKTASIPYGQCDSTSTSTVFTATVPGVTELRDGVCMWLKNGVVTSVSGFTINVNNLGAKPVYNNMAAATRDTTIWNINYTMFFVYDSTRVEGGCWILYRGYNSDNNTIGYQLRTNSTSLTTTDRTRYYRILFTSADDTHWVPANTQYDNSATSNKTINQRKINPFGRIVYLGNSTSYLADAVVSATAVWDQYAFNLGYSFSKGSALTMTFPKPVYIKCAPQSDGSAVIDSTNPFVQDLPTTDDGKIYIYLGVAYSATNVEMVINHPIYYYKDGAIREWSNAPAAIASVAWGDITGTLSNQTDLNTALGAKANSADLATVATSGSYNDLTNKPTVPEIKRRTNATTVIDISPLYVAGDGTTTYPMALKTHGDDRAGSFAYININEPTDSITEAYAGGYVWDQDESWWRKMSEVRLALYSDIPAVPTVNNATLTIQKNGTTVNTFTANASSNVTANITVPTATSDLTNDSGFIDEVSTITNARIDEIMGVA